MNNYKVKDFCKINYGKDHKKIDDGNIDVYGSGGIMAARKVNKSIYDKPSVLIPRKGTLGNVFYVNKPFWCVDTIFWTEIDESICLTKYFYYFMLTIDLANKNVGSAVPSMTTGILYDIDITLPALDEQVKIANILSCLDDKIEINNIISGKLEEMASLLYKQWFVDFEFPNDEGRPYKSNGGKMV